MKKINLIGMFALTFALVFGVAACNNGSSSSADSGTDIVDVTLKDLELKGYWKCTSWDGSYDVSDPEAFKALYGYEYKAADVTIDDDYLETFDIDLTASEDAAQTYFKNIQEKEKAEAKAEEAKAKLTDEQIAKYNEEAGKAFCALYGVTYVDYSAEGEDACTLDGDSKYTEENSYEFTVTFKKGDKEYTLTVSESSTVVWEKQEKKD